jgi:hypothetical protein
MTPTHLTLGARRGEAECGPALLGGWIGGGLLAAAALSGGLGWLPAAALCALGGSLLALRLRQPAPRPVRVRARS